MGKLMKYEFRKIRNIALGLLVVTGIAEVGYLIGLLTLNPARMEDMSDSWLLAGGILALIACAVVGVYSLATRCTAATSPLYLASELAL